MSDHQIEGLAAVNKLIRVFELFGAFRFSEYPHYWWSLNMPYQAAERFAYDHDEPELELARMKQQGGDDQLTFADTDIYEAARAYLIDGNATKLAVEIERISIKRRAEWDVEMEREEEDARRERAMLAGMEMGIDAYNDHMGYGGGEDGD